MMAPTQSLRLTIAAFVAAMVSAGDIGDAQDLLAEFTYGEWSSGFDDGYREGYASCEADNGLDGP